MRLCSRYISSKVTSNLLAATLILVSLIWFSRAIGFVKFITDNGVKLSQFFNLFLLILPWILLFIIPISLLFSILITFNKMIVDNEVTILKNCGLNKIQICRPTFKIAIFCSLFCYLISFYLMPYANKELRNAKRYLTSNYASLSFTPKTFENLNNLTIYIKDRDSDNNLVGILIHDKRPIKYSLTITAEKGYISAENNSALLYMENGTIQRFNHEQVKSEIINFDNYVFNLSDNSSIDDKKILKPRERTINELLSYNDYFDDGVEPEEIRAEIHQRLTYPLLSINLSMIGLAFILRGSFSRRGNTKNIVLAIICSASLVAITTMIYSFIVNAPQFIAALYMVMVLFFIANLRMLKKN